MKFTGERFMPEVHGDIELEHLHRYLLACRVATGKLVLDIASGEGYGSAMLARTARKVTGVDISQEAVSHAQAKYQSDNLEFRLGSCSAIPLEDASVDVVVSFETVEHHDEHDAMMLEIKRVLRPDGVLVISSPDKLEFTDKPGTVNPHHIKELYRDEFKNLLDLYFKSHSIYGQKVLYGSAIFCEDNSSPVESYELADEQLPAISGVPHAVYLVAVASDAELPQLVSGVLEQRIEDTDFTRFWRGLMAERDGQIAQLIQCAVDRDKQIANLNQVVAEQDTQIVNLNLATDELNLQLAALIEERDRILSSTSWKITKPLRFIRSSLMNRAYYFLRKITSDSARRLWVNLPLSARRKQLIKHKLFSNLPFIFRWSKAYRNWYGLSSSGENRHKFTPGDFSSLVYEEPACKFVPLLYELPPKEVPVKLIAFYLPQFHAIEENNKWWGEGFTEWTNVKPAEPQFEGHYQPHVPGELGYYNLLEPMIQRRQVELAKIYGIGGFCFYSYWFHGKLLLEKPLENYLDDSSLNLPFCICWANENWSRRWDGLDSEILIAQEHSPADDIGFIEYVARFMCDERYIRIDGKPLLLVYRPSLLPSAKETAARWREWCRNHGIGEIYLAYTQSFEVVEPSQYGFDAAIEFPPNNSSPPDITNTIKPLNNHFAGKVYDWRIFVQRARNYPKANYPLFRTVCPSWDNTARRKAGGAIFLNSSPRAYQEWLTHAVVDTCSRIPNQEERLVFVNSWNEWAEGAHLEPDQRYGYAYLDATRKALTSQRALNAVRKIVVVSHDAHPHGAQFLALNIVRSLKYDLHLEIETVLLGRGTLISDFAAIASVHELSAVNIDSNQFKALAAQLAQRGFNHAIVNTTVSGAVIPVFCSVGIESIALVHELSGIIQSYHLEDNVKKIAQFAKTVVFPEQMVADGFAQFADIKLKDKQLIRPQGLYRRNKWRFEKATARIKLRDQLGLNSDTKIVLAVGYADHRKGVDLFVESAFTILAGRQDTRFVWVGQWEHEMQQKLETKLLKSPYKNRLHFVGYNPEVALFYAAADVYALTSREDPFPSVVLESFDASVPVVAFAGTGGAANLLEKVGGLVVPSEDVAKFSDAVCRLLDDEDMSARLGTAGQNYADDNFAFRSYVFDLCRLLGIELPKISVVVPNYNYEHHIEERLASIFSQSVPIYELIIIDDASTDNSVARISAWLAANQVEARLIVNPTNSANVFAQWQKGIAMATGDYLWIAESDDLSEPDFLETVLPPLLSGNVVLSYCESQQMSAQGQILADNYHDYLSAVSNDKWQSPYIADGIDECKSVLPVLNTIPNVSAVVFRRDAVSRVFKQYFDEIAYFKRAGDWVTYLYVLEHGNIAFSPRAANKHRRHGGSIIGESAMESLLQEIIEVQDKIAGMYALSDAVQQQVQAYRLKLAKSVK